MKHSERFALNQWLSAYPNNVSYEQVLALLLKHDNEVCIWEMAENHSPEYVADLIEDTRFAVEQMMDDLVYAVTLSDKTEEESLEEGITT
jgi:hypothetical protein